MLNFDMPVGTPTYFEGDISKSDPNAFGFFNVEVTAPIDLNRPILQTRVKTKTGFRTIAPLGV
jgi:DNA polymerase type B, organellar and viral